MDVCSRSRSVGKLPKQGFAESPLRRLFVHLAIPDIPNQTLTSEEIPSSEGDLNGWIRFAHTINGYEVMGDFAACADLVSSGSASILTELRCALFFEARRECHSGGCSSDEQLIRNLLKRIRLKVEAGELY